MSTDIKELTNLVQKELHDLNQRHEELKKDVDNGEVKSIIDKQAESIAEQTEKLSNLNMKLDAEQKRNDALEMKLSGMSKSEKDEEKELLKDLNSLLRKGEISDLLRTKGVTEASDQQGGYTVPHDISARLIEIDFEHQNSSPIELNATVETTSSDHREYREDTGEFEASWGNECLQVNETNTSNLQMVRIDLGKLIAYPKISEEIMEDSSINLMNWVGNKVSKRFTRLKNSAYVSGDGINKPRGFLTYPATAGDAYEFQKIQQVDLGAGPSVENLLDMQAKVNEIYAPNTRWFMNRATMAEILKINADTQYHFLAFQQNNLPGDSGHILLGRPVVIVQDMPNIALNGLPIAYGDMRETYTVLRKPTTVMSVRDDVTDPGCTRIYFRERVGGGVVNSQAMKLGVITA